MNKSKIIASAQKYLQKGQFTKAIKEYLKLVSEDPNDIRTWLKIADLYSKSGDLVNATETYQKVADYYAKQGFYLKAVAVNKQILKIDPNLLEVHLELANLYKQLGLLGDAIAQYQSVISQLEFQGRRVESIEVFRKMLELDPDNITGRIKLAESYSKEGMIDDAVREFAIACDYLKENGRINDYVKVAERLIYHQPTNMDLAKELAQLYLDRNDPKRSLAKLQLCFKENPKDEMVLAMLADAFNALGQTQKTIPVLKELIRIYQENGKNSEVEETYRIILQLDPGDKSAVAYLGEPQEIESKVAAGKKKSPPPAPPRAPAESLDLDEIKSVDDVMSIDVEAMSVDIEQLSMEEEFSIDFESSQEMIEEQSGAEVKVAQMPNRGNTQELFGEIDALESADESVEEMLALDEIEVIEDGSESVEMEFSESSSASIDAPEAPGGEKQLKKLLTEVEIYIKLNLHEKALQHLNRIFDIDSENLEALAYTKEIYEYLGYQDKVVEVLIRLSELVSEQDTQLARDFLEEAIQIDPHNREVTRLLAANNPSLAPPPLDDDDTDQTIRTERDFKVPEPVYTREDEEFIDGQLDEIGFFLEAGLNEEAVLMFEELQTRFPVHPKIVAKAREVSKN